MGDQAETMTENHDVTEDAAAHVGPPAPVRDRDAERALLAAQRSAAKTASERVRTAACQAYVRAVGHPDVRSGATEEQMAAGRRRLAMARIAYRTAGGKPTPVHFEADLTDEERAAAAALHPITAAFRANRYSEAIVLALQEGFLSDSAVTALRLPEEPTTAEPSPVDDTAVLTPA